LFQPQIVRLGDVDGDADIDIVAAQTRQVSTWLNTGGGWEHGPAWNEPTEIVSNLLVAEVARGPEAELVIAFGTQVKVVGLVGADLEVLTVQGHSFSGPVGEHLIDQGGGVADLLLSGNVQYASPPASGVERFEGFPPGYFEAGELLPLSLPTGLTVSDVTDLTGDGVGDLLWATVSGLRMSSSTAVATAPEPGVVPTDSNAPEGATVSQSLTPTVTFSGALNGSTVASGIHLYDAQTFAPVPATVTYDAAARRVTIKPTKALAPSTAFAIEGFGLKDAAGRDVSFYRTFKTGTGTRPKVGINGTYVPSPADFDANGGADLFLYNPTGNETMIFASRLGFQVVPPFNGAPSGIRFTTADFDGNGFEDLFGHWPGTGRDFVQLAGPNGFTLKYTSNVSGTYSPLAGDFDGDGFGDLMFYAPGGTGETIWWGAATGFGTTAAPRSTTSVAGTYKPITGDFDGDGDSDIIWFAAGTTADHLWKGNANRRFSPSSLTIIGRYRLAPTDFDGDGDDDVVLYAPGSTADKLWKASPTGFTTASLSIGGTYVPIGGDFNADGRGDLLLYAAGTTSEVVRWGTGTGLSP
jgi:hypothetical protein